MLYTNNTDLFKGFKTVKKFKRKAMGFLRFSVTRTLEELAQIVMDMNLVPNLEEAKEFVRGMNENGFQYTSFGTGFVVEKVPKQICERYRLSKSNCYGL